MTDQAISQVSDAEDEPIMQWERVAPDEVRNSEAITTGWSGTESNPLADAILSHDHAKDGSWTEAHPELGRIDREEPPVDDDEPAQWFDVCRVALDQLAEAYCWMEVVEGVVSENSASLAAMFNARKATASVTMQEVGRRAWIEATAAAAIRVRAAIAEAKASA